MFVKIKRREIVVLLSRQDGVARERRWRFGLGEHVGGHRSSICATSVVRLAVHVLVLCDALLPRLAADQRPPHGTRDDAARDNDDGGAENDPSSPCHVRYEEQDVDQESEQCD
jgi:hypothetical protein